MNFIICILWTITLCYNFTLFGSTSFYLLYCKQKINTIFQEIKGHYCRTSKVKTVKFKLKMYFVDHYNGLTFQCSSLFSLSFRNDRNEQTRGSLCTPNLLRWGISKQRYDWKSEIIRICTNYFDIQFSKLNWYCTSYLKNSTLKKTEHFFIL